MTAPEGAPTAADTLRRAYLTIDRMQRKLDSYERARSEPVAIVGLACRFPGGAVDAASYWLLLANGVDAVGEIPANRWQADDYYDQRPQQPGKMTTRWGGFVDGVGEFDYEFFGISRREALAMDPQQRLTLEVAWEALENAGLAPGRLAGSRTGVFMGVCSSDFGTEMFRHPRDITAYASTGTAHSVVTGRLSYLLDFRGPSLAIDSACSSSLVAVQLACQSLHAGESDLAVSGGVNVVFSPLPSIAFSQFPGMVAADGRCRTFDAAANGYVRSEGCGIVVLKRLADAVRDGDQVLALVRGGAVNQDGRSSGVTAPNGLAQRDVLRRALAASGTAPGEVGYIEAHGTGTRLGDPIEVEALAEVYGRPDGTPVYLGSAKTNIGHPEAAAGIAGLIKVVLALQHAVIPPNVHFTELNPHLSFDGTTFAVPTALTPWPSAADGQAARRIAGVSSFGFSGTNAHVILESAPARPLAAAQEELDGQDAVGPDSAAQDRFGPSRPRSVLALSAKSRTALVALAERYATRLADHGDGPVADICFSANTGRSHFRYRLAAVGATADDIAALLTDFADGLPGDEPAVGEAAGDGAQPGVVFLFTGQGPQRPGMARSLYETQPAFRATLHRCAGILRPVLATPLLEVLYPTGADTELIYQTVYSQPALFAVEYALAELWRSWGVEPAAVLGHSFGEYVAACVAGAMSLEDGLALAAERGRLMQSLAQDGAMAAVFAPEELVAEAISGHADQLSIAAVNGPDNTAISGRREAVAAVCTALAERGVEAKLLRIATSSHSPLIEPILGPLRAAARSVRFTPPRIPLVSNLTGDLWPWDSAPDADYWCQHARQPVRFAAGAAAVRAMGHHVFLEAGPAPTLLGLLGDGQPGPRELLLPSLRPGHDDWQVLLASLSRLYAGGADIDWAAFDRGYRRTRVTVPTYPFDRTRCWPEPARRDAGHAADSADPIGPASEETADAATGAAYADEDLLYRLAWQAADPVADPPEQAAGPQWIVFADDTGVGDALAAAVTASGGRCLRVVPGTEYRYDGHGAATIRADEPADFTRLLADSAAPPGPSAGEPPTDPGVIVAYLWGLSAAGASSGLPAAGAAGCMRAVRMAQALAADVVPPPRLWLVTRGAVPADPARASARPGGLGLDGTAGTVPADLAQSVLWGLGRSLQQELATAWGGLTDLDPADNPQTAAARLFAEIAGGGAGADGAGAREDQVAFRNGQRYVARLVRAKFADGVPAHVPADPVPASPAPAGPWAGWRADASYLITGGLGGLGLAVARSMVQAGARRLVLLGRTPLPPRTAWATLAAADPAARRVAAVRELESLGASVIPVSLDIADYDAARGFLGRFDAEGWPPIRGVVHAAGTGDLAPLASLTPADLSRHLGPKAQGAWVLHRLFAGRPLDFFVLFSSASSVLSSPFVASYAAANAFLDALAAARTAAGQPGLSVSWGIWSRTGLAERGGDATPGLSQGMGTLDPAQAVRVFHRLVRDRTAGHVAVVPVDWDHWGRRYAAVSGSALLTELTAETAAADGTVRPAGLAGRLPDRAELLAFDPGERLAVLCERLLRAVTATLGGEPGAVRADQPLVDVGLDSLMAVELRNEVDQRLGVTVPISVLLEGATVSKLAEYIAGELSADPSADRDTAIVRVRPGPDADLQERLLGEIAGLSDAEARASLDGEAAR